MATVYTSAGEEAVVDLIDGTSSTHLDNTNAHIATRMRRRGRR